MQEAERYSRQETPVMPMDMVPLADSPLSAAFQHADDARFSETCLAYDRLWTAEGRFPQIDFPAPRPFKRFVPKMFICTNWTIGKTLLQEGTVDEHDPRPLQMLAPRGTTNRGLHLLMATRGGALGRLLVQHGVPHQYPHLAELTTDYLSFVMPDGEKHDTLRNIYGFPASPERIASWDYQRLLREGAAAYLDNLCLPHAAGQTFPADLAVTLGRGTVIAAMARVWGMPHELLDTVLELSRSVDGTLTIGASHAALTAADGAVATACGLLEHAATAGELAPDGVLAHEFARLVTPASAYTARQWAFIALMLLRFSMENQIDAVNLMCRRFAALSDDQQQSARRDGHDKFLKETMRSDPPAGFILRFLPRSHTFDTPVPGRRLTLPAGSFAVLVPRVLHSPLLSNNSGDYLLTFGYGRGKICPGRQLALLTVSICTSELFQRFAFTYPSKPVLSESAFFRRILSAPGEVTILPAGRVARATGTVAAS